MDIWCFSNIPNCRYGSYFKFDAHLSPTQETLQKILFERFSLPSNHIFKLIIDMEKSCDHQHFSLNNLMIKQKSKLHSPLINMNKRCNEFLPTFSLFDDEFSSGSRLIDLFSDCYSFHDWTRDIKGHLQNLDTITIDTSNDPHSSIMIVDVSIWNNIATSISHIHLHNSPVIKIIYQVVNVTTTESELFAIRCRIN